jgi:hypothetical protein
MSVRTCFLLVLLGLAVLAMPAAATAESVEVLYEVDNDDLPCEEPCVVHSVSEIPTTTTVIVGGFPIVASICQEELNATLNLDGTGSITDQVFTGANCTQKPCEATSSSSGDGDPWPVALEETSTPGIETVDFTRCVEPAGGGTERECTTSWEADPDFINDHLYHVTAANEVCAESALIRESGEWVTESELEVIHGD